MNKLLCALCAIMLCAGAAVAANTTLVGSSLTTVEITGLDADWSWPGDIVTPGTFSDKVATAKIRSIKFYPSAANDRMVIRDGGNDAATFFDSGLVSAATDPRIEYYDPPRHVDLYIDISDSTLNTAANCKVVIQIEPEK